MNEERYASKMVGNHGLGSNIISVLCSKDLGWGRINGLCWVRRYRH